MAPVAPPPSHDELPFALVDLPMPLPSLVLFILPGWTASCGGQTTSIGGPPSSPPSDAAPPSTDGSPTPSADGSPTPSADGGPPPSTDGGTCTSNAECAGGTQCLFSVTLACAARGVCMLP